MQITIETKNPFNSGASLVVAPLHEKDLHFSKPKSLSPLFKQLTDFNPKACAEIAGFLYQAEFKGESLKIQPFALPGTSIFHQLLVVGATLAKASNFDQIEYYRKLGNIVADNARRLKATSVALWIGSLDFSDTTFVDAFFEGLELSDYKFDRYKSSTKRNKRPQPFKIKQLILCNIKRVQTPKPQAALAKAQATMYARDLINIPAKDCTPKFLVDQAQQISKRYKFGLTVFNKEKLKSMNAGALLSVAQGSSEPPFLVKLVYKPSGKKSKRVVSLIGKGVTFDSGGLSIKTGAGMETMKSDMSGAAAVLSVMRAIGELKPAFEIRAYIPTTENMINGAATRPGDVVHAMSGKSIEILNTDAEGRLILADALTVAERDKCDVMIDIATLTGACRIALGASYAGLFSNNDKLAQDLLKASEKAGERLWRMPLAPEYKEMIKSPIADIKNTGGAYGGAITGALFLEEFVTNTDWAHLDIAGVAFSDSEKGYIKKGGVGFGVRTLINYLLP